MEDFLLVLPDDEVEKAEGSKEKLGRGGYFCRFDLLS